MADDISALCEVIDTTDLFPSTMLHSMVAPYLSGNAPDDLWVTTAGASIDAVAYCAREPLTSGSCNLLLIAVHTRTRSSGLGMALLRHVEAVLAARGDRLLLVDTSSTDAYALARAFYRRAGYEEEARIRDYYEAGDAKVTFRRLLP